MDDPHVWFYINVKNPDGTLTNWGFEMGPPHGLQQRGWNRTTMKLGDEVLVVGSQARNGSNRGNARTVTMVATGQRLERRPAKTTPRNHNRNAVDGVTETTKDHESTKGPGVLRFSVSFVVLVVPL